MELMVQQLILRKMNGKFIILLISLLFLNCKNKVVGDAKSDNLKEQIASEFITKNINILIDSVENFDMSKVPKFKDIKIEKLKIALVDSIVTDKNSFGAFLNFKLDEKCIANYKSDCEIILVPRDDEDLKYLFVQFSNFTLEDNIAQVVVKKRIGISMEKDKYYFEKMNNKWILKKKQLLSMG